MMRLDEMIYRPMTEDEQAAIVDALSQYGVPDDERWFAAFDAEAEQRGFIRTKTCPCRNADYGHDPRCGWGYVEKLDDSPNRVVVQVNPIRGVSPKTAAREYDVTPDWIFVRNDGWKLGAPEKFRAEAYALYKNEWTSVFATKK